MRSREHRQKGGNDPAFGCRASPDALVVPALWVQSLEQNKIRTRSKPDQFKMLN